MEVIKFWELHITLQSSERRFRTCLPTGRFGICVIIKFVLPFWLCCLAVFVNVSFVVNKMLFKKNGRVVPGSSLSSTPLYRSVNYQHHK